MFEDLAFAARFEGLQQIRSFIDLTYAGAPDYRVVPHNIIADGSKLAVEWVMDAGLRATGKRFEVRAVSIVTLRGTTISSMVDDWSPLDFQRAVGLL